MIRMSILAIVSQFITYATLYGFAPIVAKNLGADSFQIGLMSMIGTIPGLFVSPLCATVLLRKIGPGNIVAGGFFLAALACGLVPFSTSLGFFYFLQFIGGVGRGAVFPLLMGMSVEGVPSERRATVMGFYQAFYSFGIFVGPAVAGFIGNYAGMNAAFFITGIIGLAGMEAARRILRR